MRDSVRNPLDEELIDELHNAISAGAYQRDKARRYGLLDEQENPDQENVELMQAANEQVSQWMDEQF